MKFCIRVKCLINFINVQVQVHARNPQRWHVAVFLSAPAVRFCALIQNWPFPGILSNAKKKKKQNREHCPCKFLRWLILSESRVRKLIGQKTGNPKSREHLFLFPWTEPRSGSWTNDSLKCPSGITTANSNMDLFANRTSLFPALLFP